MRLITPLCMLIFTLLLAGCKPTTKNEAPPGEIDSERANRRSHGENSR